MIRNGEINLPGPPGCSARRTPGSGRHHHGPGAPDDVVCQAKLLAACIGGRSLSSRR